MSAKQSKQEFRLKSAETKGKNQSPTSVSSTESPLPRAHVTQRTTAKASKIIDSTASGTCSPRGSQSKVRHTPSSIFSCHKSPLSTSGGQSAGKLSASLKRRSSSPFHASCTGTPGLPADALNAEGDCATKQVLPLSDGKKSRSARREKDLKISDSSAPKARYPQRIQSRLDGSKLGIHSIGSSSSVNSGPPLTTNAKVEVKTPFGVHRSRVGTPTSDHLRKQTKEKSAPKVQTKIHMRKQTSNVNVKVLVNVGVGDTTPVEEYVESDLLNQIAAMFDDVLSTPTNDTSTQALKLPSECAVGDINHQNLGQVSKAPLPLSISKLAHKKVKKANPELFSLPDRITQLCSDIDDSFELLCRDGKSNPDDVLQLTINLHTLYELVQCWLTVFKEPVTEAGEKAQTVLTNLLNMGFRVLDNAEQDIVPPQRLKSESQTTLSRFVFFFGKRCIDLNIGLRPSTWTSISETVMDALAKAASTQFTYALHSLADSVGKSLEEIDTIANRSYLENRSEAILMLLKSVQSLMDNVHEAMEKFRMWHANTPFNTTLNSSHEYHFLWHFESSQYLNKLMSCISSITEGVAKIVPEPGDGRIIAALDDSLHAAENLILDIQKHLPFSGDSDRELDESMGDSLTDLESGLRKSVETCRSLYLVLNKFTSCKGILKKCNAEVEDVRLADSVQHFEETTTCESENEMMDGDGDNESRHVHFSESS